MKAGFMTVEAALLFPTVLFVVCFVIYIWFLKVDYALAAIYTCGAVVTQTSAADMEGRVKAYVAAESVQMEVKQSGMKIECETKGELEFPFIWGELNDILNIWHFEVKESGVKIDKSSAVRIKRKVRKKMGGDG